MRDYQRWQKFWNSQQTPLHAYNNEEWHKRYADEINSLVSSLGYSGGAVLETGCGNGALFEYLNINKMQYTGVDFSKSLLRIFRLRFPEVNLVCAEASSFSTINQKFELIFSNGVIQYFNGRMLQNYVTNSLNMLKSDGILLLTNVPWRELRKSYISGELARNPHLVSPIRLWARMIRLSLYGDHMGYWYNPRDFLRFANNRCQLYIFGSLYHPYRFSVAMKKVR